MTDRRDKQQDKPKSRNPLEWRSFPYWYLLLMLILLWAWQGAMQFTVKEIHYSDFKSYLSKGEVVEAEVHETMLRGKIKPQGDQKGFLFRTVRIEDSKLTEELE